MSQGRPIKSSSFTYERGHAYSKNEQANTPHTPSDSTRKQIIHSFEELESTWIQKNNVDESIIPPINPEKQNAESKEHPNISVQDNGRTLVFRCNDSLDLKTTDVSASPPPRQARIKKASEFPLSLGVDTIDYLLDDEDGSVLGQQLLKYLRKKTVKLNEVIHLVESGASVNYQNESGVSPLMLAAVNPFVSIEILEYLLDQTAELELEDCNGDTAFFYSVCQPSISKIKILMAHQANIYHKNKRGESFYFKSFTSVFANRKAVLDYLLPFYKQQNERKNVRSSVISQWKPVTIKEQPKTLPYYSVSSEDIALNNDNIGAVCRTALTQCSQHSEYLERFKNGWVFAFVANRNNMSRYSTNQGMFFFPSLPVASRGGLNGFSFYTTAKSDNPMKIIVTSGSNEQHLALSKGAKTMMAKTSMKISKKCIESSLTLCFPLKEREWFLCYSYRKTDDYQTCQLG